MFFLVHHCGFFVPFPVFDRKLPKKALDVSLNDMSSSLFVRQKSGESVLAIFGGDTSSRVSLISDETTQNLSLCQKLFLVFLKF